MCVREREGEREREREGEVREMMMMKIEFCLRDKAEIAFLSRATSTYHYFFTE